MKALSTWWGTCGRSARWITVLWALLVLTQRLHLPGVQIPLILPITVGWLALAYWRGVVELDRQRMCWWLLAVGAAAPLMVVQSAFVAGAQTSVLSWGLFAMSWLVMTVRLVDRELADFQQAMVGVIGVCVLLAVAAIAMMLTQLLGIGWTDVVAQVVPLSMRFVKEQFIITYPVTYGSSLMRSNAWIGLEPSFISFQLGIGMLAALVARRSAISLVVMGLALICTVSGSGIAVVGVGMIILLVFPYRRVLRRYVWAGVVGLLTCLVTPIGQLLLARVNEGGRSSSSLSLRAVAPYLQLLPDYVASPVGVLLGYGPGSSQRAANATAISGLLVPTPIKVFFEYGAIVGLLIAAFMVVCYLETPSRSLSVALFVSFWTLQSGMTNPLLVTSLFIVATGWSPRVEEPVELLLRRRPEIAKPNHLPSRRARVLTGG